MRPAVFVFRRAAVNYLNQPSAYNARLTKREYAAYKLLIQGKPTGLTTEEEEAILCKVNPEREIRSKFGTIRSVLRQDNTLRSANAIELCNELEQRLIAAECKDIL
jgi:hypothetical protein